MPDTEQTRHTESGRYREKADALLALVPAMKDPAIAADLRLLAAAYQKLAESVEAAPNPPQENLASDSKRRGLCGVSPAQAAQYRQLAEGIRTLVPTWNNSETRSELAWMAACYDRLADFTYDDSERRTLERSQKPFH